MTERKRVCHFIYKQPAPPERFRDALFSNAFHVPEEPSVCSAINKISLRSVRSRLEFALVKTKHCKT